MSSCRLIWAAVVVISGYGCQSANQKAQFSEQSLAVISKPAITARSSWPIPPDLPTLGLSGLDSIRVAVFGRSVKRPGYYYLQRGATVHDAMETAQFSGFVGWQRPYSGIQRQSTNGSVVTIWFTEASRIGD